MINICIIGAGRIAKIHAKNLSTISGVNILYIVDKSIEVATELAIKYNAKVSSLNDALKDPLINAVVILSPTHTHADYMELAAKAGKHIFCEKPIAKNTTQAKEMIQCCEENQVKLVINHSRRWHNNFIYAKKQIDSAAFGKIVSITGRYTSGLRVMGTHMIDIMSFLCGPVISISGVKKEKEIKGKLKYSENFSNNDPSYSALLNFNNNIVGFLEGSCHKKYLLFELDIHFTDGRISIINNGQKIDLWRHNKGLLSQLPDVNIKLNSTIMNAVNSNIDCLEFGTETPSSGKDGFYALEIIEKILRSDLIHNKEKVWKN